MDLTVNPAHSSLPPSTQLNQATQLSATDKKTHLYVLGYLLLAVGITLACATFYLATMVHPMIAMASPIVPIAVAALCLDRAKNAPAPVQKPKDQPLGLRNKNAKNCWLVSGIQLAANLPAYRKAIQKVRDDFETRQKTGSSVLTYSKLCPFVRAIEQYEAECKQGSPVDVSSIDPQELREWLYDRTTTISKADIKKLSPEELQFKKEFQPITERAALQQEDVTEFFKFFLEESGHQLTIVEQTCTRYEENHPDNGTSSVTRLGGGEQSPLYFISLILDKFKDTKNLTLNFMLDHGFFEDTEPTPTEKGENRITRRFESPPDDLTIFTSRESYAYDSKGKPRFQGKEEEKRQITHKLHTKITTPLVLEGSAKNFSAEVKYQCDGFIVHIGDSNSDGHYRAYFRKNKQWFCADDTRTYPIDEETIIKIIPYFYVIHYQKI